MLLGLWIRSRSRRRSRLVLHRHSSERCDDFLPNFWRANIASIFVWSYAIGCGYARMQVRCCQSPQVLHWMNSSSLCEMEITLLDPHMQRVRPSVELRKEWSFMIQCGTCCDYQRYYHGGSTVAHICLNMFANPMLSYRTIVTISKRQV